MLERMRLLQVGAFVSMCVLGSHSVSAQAPTLYTRQVTPVPATPFDATASHDILVVTTVDANFIINLPQAVTSPPQPITSDGIKGRHFTVKKVDAGTGTVKIVAQSGQNIDGQASYFLSAKDQEVSVVSDGANWKLLDAVPKGVLHAHTFPGANAGAKIAAACAALPSGGGSIDGRGFGATTQVVSSDMFAACNKPVTLIVGGGTIYDFLDPGPALGTTKVTLP